MKNNNRATRREKKNNVSMTYLGIVSLFTQHSLSAHCSALLFSNKCLCVYTCVRVCVVFFATAAFFRTKTVHHSFGLCVMTNIRSTFPHAFSFGKHFIHTDLMRVMENVFNVRWEIVIWKWKMSIAMCRVPWFLICLEGTQSPFAVNGKKIGEKMNPEFNLSVFRWMSTKILLFSVWRRVFWAKKPHVYHIHCSTNSGALPSMCDVHAFDSLSRKNILLIVPHTYTWYIVNK